MKALSLVLIVFILSSASLGQANAKVIAREACADDFWKWCGANEAPYDCFKRRGFFKKDSALSLECRRSWARPKSDSEPTPPVPTAPTTPPQELRAQEAKPVQAAPQQNIEAPKEVAPAAGRKPSSDPGKSTVPAPEIVDDFSELSFD